MNSTILGYNVGLDGEYRLKALVIDLCSLSDAHLVHKLLVKQIIAWCWLRGCFLRAEGFQSALFPFEKEMNRQRWCMIARRAFAAGVSGRYRYKVTPRKSKCRK